MNILLILIMFSSLLFGVPNHTALASTNGDELRYDQAAFVTTHNAYANAADGWLLPWGVHQQQSISQQLEAGVSALMLDIWTYKPLFQDLNICLWHGDPNSFYSGLVGGPPGLMKTLREGLQDVVACLKKDPQRIITLFFEDHVPEGGKPALDALDKVLENPEIKKYSFRPHDLEQQQRLCWDVAKQGWPTLGWLRRHDLRLVMFTESRTSSQALAYTWDYSLENVYGNSSLNPQTFCELRPESAENRDRVMGKTNGQPLLLMNHFPTLPFNLGLGLEIFSPHPYPSAPHPLEEELRQHIAMMKERYGRMPTFIALNYALGMGHDVDRTVLNLVEELHSGSL